MTDFKTTGQVVKWAHAIKTHTHTTNQPGRGSLTAWRQEVSPGPRMQQKESKTQSTRVPADHKNRISSQLGHETCAYKTTETQEKAEMPSLGTTGNSAPVWNQVSVPRHCSVEQRGGPPARSVSTCIQGIYVVGWEGRKTRNRTWKKNTFWLKIRPITFST